jgi:hypothetical protein
MFRSRNHLSSSNLAPAFSSRPELRASVLCSLHPSLCSAPVSVRGLSLSPVHHPACHERGPRATIPFRIRTYRKHIRKPFGIRTYKTQNLNSFRIRTYKKTGGPGVLIVNQHDVQGCLSRTTSGRVGQPILAVLFPVPQITSRRSRVLLFPSLDYNIHRISVEGICAPIEWKFPGTTGSRTG